MPRVLIVTYYWPPGSGAGVQRWLKFSRYMPQFGWEPVILTVDPGFAAFPALDKSLEAEIPADLEVYKTKATDYFRIYSKDKSKIPSSGFASNENNGIQDKIIRFIRGNFFIPDPRRGWNKFAFRQACSLIGKYKISHVITTSPPHSTQLIGLKLKKRFPDIEWIADLRDPWTDIYYYDRFFPTFPARKIDLGYELKVLTSADRIITVGRSLKNLFSSRGEGIEKKTEIIYNGFDEDDFSGYESAEPDVFTVSYIGTLSDSYPVNGLLTALMECIKEGIDLKMKFVGFVSDSRKRLLTSVLGEKRVEFTGYVDHRTAIGNMFSSSLLLLIIPDHKSSQSIITGKLFEYLATGKPILCLGPSEGDAAEILRVSGHKGIFSWEDRASVKEFISRTVKQKVAPERGRISSFSRKELTRKLCLVLDSCRH